MPVFGHKSRLSTDLPSRSSTVTKRHRFFARHRSPVVAASSAEPASPNLTSLAPTPAVVSPGECNPLKRKQSIRSLRSVRKLRRSLSHLFARLWPRSEREEHLEPVDIGSISMDPSNNELDPFNANPVLDNVYRKRSVRFLPSQIQLDGSETPSTMCRVSKDINDRVTALQKKVDGASNVAPTVVHRMNLRAKPSVPYIDTTPSTLSSRAGDEITDSVSPKSGNHFSWSPASTASTGATSLNSLTSPCSACVVAEEHLTPIEEDSRRQLRIPVQETPLRMDPSVITVEKVAAAKISLETHFNNLMTDSPTPRSIRRRRFEQMLCDMGVPHEDRDMARNLWTQTESANLRQERALKASSIARHSVKGIEIAGFDAIRVLGKGSFGIVRLVSERRAAESKPQVVNTLSSHGSYSSQSTIVIDGMDGTATRDLPSGKALSDVFAMKVIRKSEMLRASQEGHLRAERDFLVNAEGSRWVVPLISSFQDNTNLYLVMEYMIGGDFLGLLLREDVLEEEVAK
ncbi:Hypothetical protein R9X50_00311000 [Acrodontium crateriforme]|uniref:non-specific serine/threonine protein kinase n=1 Tax=Acrodontium crateriforme TaxID=150365 RepID=A0AAQ3R977_9PEZI|nr:Hypothetical protein R9X50_00311000 [Acrodontium crateriforme]